MFWPSTWPVFEACGDGHFLEPWSIPTEPGVATSLPHLQGRKVFVDYYPRIKEVTNALWSRGIRWPSCSMCRNHHTLEHTCGKAHFWVLWKFVEERAQWSLEDLKRESWQRWHFRGGGLSFNHIDGSVYLWSDGSDGSAASSGSLPSPAPSNAMVLRDPSEGSRRGVDPSQICVVG